ncbi:hypothetical protein ASD64_16035 [Mesorhizobium sp. Root157]|uniref:hypothetical protein n=1 Tax=Mesorhizobium sp. Root157 TaxID=1736477 RepID=UPI0006F987DE|nr:hypothetical protein [Mesorhizobium sp. Root157]KQZ98478.1 hypothetical protein ASD64_16035 [Mesorhizobium sp. Root157]
MSVCPICCGTRRIVLPVRGDDALVAHETHREYACPECGQAHIDAEEVAVAAVLEISFGASCDPDDEGNISKGQAVDAVMDALRLVIEQYRPRQEAA